MIPNNLPSTPLSQFLTSEFSNSGASVSLGNFSRFDLRPQKKSTNKVKTTFSSEDLLKVKNLYCLLEQVASEPASRWDSAPGQQIQLQAAQLLHYFAFHKEWDSFLEVIAPVYALVKLDARVGQVFSQVWRNLANAGYFNSTHTSMQLLAVQLDTKTVASHWKISRRDEFLAFEAALTVALQQYYSELGWVVAFPQLISQSLLSELPASVFMTGQKFAYDLACGTLSPYCLPLPTQTTGIPDTPESLYFIPFVWGVLDQYPVRVSPRAESQAELWAHVQDCLDEVINQTRSIKPCPSRGSQVFTHGVTRISPGEYCSSFL